MLPGLRQEPFVSEKNVCLASENPSPFRIRKPEQLICSEFDPWIPSVVSAAEEAHLRTQCKSPGRGYEICPAPMGLHLTQNSGYSIHESDIRQIYIWLRFRSTSGLRLSGREIILPREFIPGNAKQ